MDDLTSSFPIINNRYLITSTIATGGMAVVYKAQDLTLERPVALKILKKELSNDQAFKNRFRQEARSSAQLIHPNIVTTFDFGYDRERLYIVMEYVDGIELKELMKKDEQISYSEAFDYLRQACAGLAYAHQMGFVHCDIKPQNMLITANKTLKITDFGISRALNTISREEQHSVVWGSPLYISPEQSYGKAPSPATDIYSLGVIAYELFSGQLPFYAQDAAELARMHRMETPRPLIEINLQIPSQLNEVVMRCLDKDPAKRYSSASELEKALSDVALLPIREDGLFIENLPNIEEEGDKKLDETKPELKTILLALLALILVGGLIPFWLYVILSLNLTNR